MNSISPITPDTHLGSLVSSNVPTKRLSVTPIAEALSAVFFDSAMPLEMAGSELEAHTGTQVLCRPLTVSQVKKSNATWRIVFLVNVSADVLVRDGLAIHHANAPLAVVDPEALQSPKADLNALTSMLTSDSNSRLLRLLLSVGRGLFGQSGSPEYCQLIWHLLGQQTPYEIPLAGWFPLGSSAAVLSYVLPPEFEVPTVSEIFAVNLRNVQRLGQFRVVPETRADGTSLLHLFLSNPPPEGVGLVAVAEPVFRLGGPVDAPARPFAPWLARRAPDVQAQARVFMAQLAETDPQIAVIEREIDCPESDLPSGEFVALYRAPGRLLYVLDARDPYDLLRSFALRSGDTVIALDRYATAQTMPSGKRLVGIVEMPVGIDVAASVQLGLNYHSGRQSWHEHASIEALPAKLPDDLDGINPKAMAPFLSELIVDRLASRPTRTAFFHDFGPDCEAPRATIVVEIDDTPDYAHVLAASLGPTPQATLVLHHARREANALLCETAADLSAIYGVKVRVAEFPEDDVYGSERLRMIMRDCDTPVAILFSDNCVPVDSDWFDELCEVLDCSTPKIQSALVIGTDGSVRDAGTRIGQDGALDQLYRGWLPDELDGESAALATGDTLPPMGCVGLNAAAWTAMRDGPPEFPTVDAELARLAMASGPTSACLSIAHSHPVVAHSAPRETQPVFAHANAYRLREGAAQ